MHGQMQRKSNLATVHGPSTRQRSYTKHHEMDFNKMYIAMEKGHKVCKINVLKKWDPAHKQLTLNKETRQLFLTKLEQTGVRNKPAILDIRQIREVQTLDYKLSAIKICDKWKKDKEIQNFDPLKILVISHGTGFTLKEWTLLFESASACRLWSQGVHNLMLETRDRDSSSHVVRIERYITKHFSNLVSPASDYVARKHMKPFVQTSLQYKIQSKQLQEVTEDQMNLVQFGKATRQLIHSHQLFSSRFTDLSDDGATVSFPNFLRFLEKRQNDELSNNRTRAIEFLRRYLNQDQSFNHDRIEPSLSVMEFCDFLFSRENSIWDPVNEKVTQDMNRPLSHYWITSSHNTYLTGDQLRSESSLDSYAQALLMGCRCIELDCWDGQRKPNSNEYQDIVIYHGYTMTSKLLLKDVLYTIKHYAFKTSEYPVILSIEDNCSVPAQRLLAQEIKEILGDDLLTQPVSTTETQLPSPAALKRKIILKHKKLPIENEELAVVINNDEFQDTDILARECIKKGLLYIKDSTSHEWTGHVFVLFADRLCYLLDSCDDEYSVKDDSVSIIGDEDKEEEALHGFGLRPEEMHVTEEWFHGRCERDEAKERILQHKERGNGLFMIRDSNLFKGDYSLSILHDGNVHHVRIKTKMIDREKKYFFMDNKVCDTLYELVSYYTRHYLTTASFKMALVVPCPQPQPHLGQPWFAATANKQIAEELLSQIPEDGAFLIRHSTGDHSVFVLSIRVYGEIWHYRLKRDGRIFVVNQTVFENLNQIVDYYSTREFVRGIGLKIPVNENYMGNVVGDMATTPSYYQELSSLHKEELARALRPFRGINEDDLNFPANATITILKKDEGLWLGQYGSAKGWFPSSYVQEILPEKTATPGVTSNYNTIELAGTVIERVTDCDRPHVIKITQSGHWTGQLWLISSNSMEDADDWQNKLLDLTRSVNDKLSTLRTKEKNARIAADLSNLVVYCQAVPFDPVHVRGSYKEMCSFVENKLDKLLEKGLVQFNIRQLSRVYPHGSRITSANYLPVPMWNASCHMVALNYQTGDKAMQLNQGKFMGNGRCGYVLKPEYMLDENFDPLQGSRVTTSCPIRLSVQIIAGRHLSRKDKNKGICSPFVEVELVGLPCDERIYKTRTIASNGLNPIWNQTFTFEVNCPELALLRFHVEDGDFVGPKTDPFIGQAVFPLDSIRSGFRSVPLLNQYSEELELSALLVDVQMLTMEGSVLVRSAHSVLQATRFSNRKITPSDSVIASAPREIAPRPHSLGNTSSIDSTTSPIGSASWERKFSAMHSEDSTESYESSNASNGHSTLEKERKKNKSIFTKMFSSRSKDKDHVSLVFIRNKSVQD